jgi:hypothetical protein
MPPTLTIDVPGARGGLATVELDPEGDGPDQALVHVPAGKRDGQGATFGAHRIGPGHWETPFSDIRGITMLQAFNLSMRVSQSVNDGLEAAYPALIDLARERARDSGRTLVAAANVIDIGAWNARRDFAEGEREQRALEDERAL